MKTLESIQDAKQYLETIGVDVEIEITGDFFYGFTADLNDGDFITSAYTLKRLADLVEDYWNCKCEEYLLPPEAWTGGFADNH